MKFSNFFAPNPFSKAIFDGTFVHFLIHPNFYHKNLWFLPDSSLFPITLPVIALKNFNFHNRKGSVI